MEPTVAELAEINSLADQSAWSNFRDPTRTAVLRALGDPVTFCEIAILPWSDYKYGPTTPYILSKFRGPHTC